MCYQNTAVDRIILYTAHCSSKGEEESIALFEILLANFLVQEIYLDIFWPTKYLDLLSELELPNLKVLSMESEVIHFLHDWDRFVRSTLERVCFSGLSLRHSSQLQNIFRCCPKLPLSVRKNPK